MKTYLITGASGFVARHLIDHLLQASAMDRIVGIDIGEPSGYFADPERRCRFDKIDLQDRDALDITIREARPDYIVHLASKSSVAYSWENPTESFLNNTNIFLNIADIVRRQGKPCRLLSIGSSEPYGRVEPADLPLREGAPLRPSSPYGVARVAQEMLSKVFSEGYGLDIVMTRSFNHFGPYQRETFVIAGFARQFALAERAGKKEFELRAGDVDVVRDFTDVRDVVRAYCSLLERGRNGEIYNVCSGVGRKLGSIVEALGKITDITARIVRDDDMIRPLENPVIVGDGTKIRSDCGWSATTSFEITLNDTLNYWRSM